MTFNMIAECAIKYSPEDLIQLECVNFTRIMCPAVLVSASQNGMYLGNSKSISGYIEKKKKLGLLPGELDIMLTWPPKQILFVEVKAGKNDCTDNQIEVIDRRRAQGFDCCVVWTLKEYYDFLCQYNVPMRTGMYAGLGRIGA